MWWLVLGVLSSIGFGSGLHSGIMFLFPFIMRIVVAVEERGTTRIWAVYNHKCLFQSWGTMDDGTVSLFNQLVLVWPAVVLWGAGTALGELPPYLVTRAARRAGNKDAAFESELEEARAKTDIISRIKIWTIDFTERNGFLGIVALASWPNAAFDMCGMACGWLDMPMWTFLGATLVGKALIKTTLQGIFFINVFSKKFFDAIVAAFDSLDLILPKTLELGQLLATQRKSLVYKFELQTRRTAAELLMGEPALDSEAIADKFCSVAGKCGEWNARSREWSDSEAYEGVMEVATRIVRHLDGVDGTFDGKLCEAELKLAESRADGKLSLGSLDPGSGGIFSLGNLWNLFIISLVCFFIVTIIDQVAKSEQASIDKREIEALEISLKGGKLQKDKSI